MKEYIIIGNTENHKDCLVCLAGYDKDHAEKVLERMLINPTDNDKHLMKGHTNFRIKEVVSENQWWNDPFLVN